MIIATLKHSLFNYFAVENTLHNIKLMVWKIVFTCKRYTYKGEIFLWILM